MDLEGGEIEIPRQLGSKRLSLAGADPVKLAVLNCTRCELSGEGNGPVPFTGPVTARVCVVGEAPGVTEDRQGIPFSGPAGQLLKQTFRDNKVNPNAVFYCNVVSCWPKRDKKTPSQKDINVCRENLWMQVNYSQATWVLAVGGIAMTALFPWQYVGKIRRTITAMRGIPWHYHGRNFYSCIHPAAALRSQERYGKLFREDIGNFVEMVRNGPRWSEECFECGKEVERYSEQGIPWCERHAR